jgi:hypothetical protein
MTKIVIAGIRPYDGEYDLDTERAFNTREWRWIKRISGYMPLTVGDGFKGGDPDLFVALAVVAMCRDGRIDRDEALEVADLIAEAPFDGASITFAGDEEDTEIPLVLTSEPDRPSPNDSLEKPNTSGADSPNGSDRSDVNPTPTTVSRLHTSAT